MVRITEVGMAAIDATSNATATESDTNTAPVNKPQEPYTQRLKV